MQPKHTDTMAMRFRGHSSVLHMMFPREEGALRALSIMLAFLVIGYITLVSMSIVNVIAHKEATDNAATLRTVVGELEREYFALAQEITAENGVALGLTSVSDTHYVRVPGAVGSADGVRDEL